MIKKIAMLALAVSTAFSSAFAAERTCSVSLKGSKIYTGSSIKPEPTVTCDDGSNPTDISIAYGTNIDVGEDAGSVTVTLNDDGTKITKTFNIAQRDVQIAILDTTKEKNAADPEFTWVINDEDGKLNAVKEDVLEELKAGLKNLIVLERVAGEEIANKDGEPYRYAITFKDGVSENIAAAFPNFNVMAPETPGYLTITKKHVTVYAKDTSKVYGKADPKFEYVIEGLDKGKYALLGDIDVTRADGDAVGEYPISVKVENVETEDYIVAVKGATFTITKAKVAVTVDDVTKVYGAATPEFTYKVDGLVGKDELKDVKLTCKACSDEGLEAVGKYEIVVSVKETSNPNYLISSTENGTMTVTPKAATVTVADTAKTYGDEDPKFTFTTEGLVTATESLKDATITRAEGEKVGTYKIDVAFADGSNPNYKLTVNSGSLTISPKAVTLTVDDVSKKFGEKDPELTYTVDGLVTIGETEDKLAGVTLSREKGEDAGAYKITATVDAKANPNYVVTVDEKEAKLTIVANNDEIVVTIKGHTSTGVYNGKEQTVHGYEISSNSDAYSLKFVEYTKTDAGDSVVSGTNAGTYKMGLSKDNFKNTSVNYPNVTFEVTDGSLEITPKSLVVSAVADSITYGDELPTEFKWTVDSLLKGDALDNIHVSIEKTGLLDAGEYKLDFDEKEPTTKNYVVSEFVPATFKVLKRNVTVSIADTSKVYGTRDPVLDSLISITGLRAGDALEGISVAREKGEDVRIGADGQVASYKIAATIDEEKINKNYLVKVKQGNFTIKPYADKITVLIFGDRIERDSTGDTITVPKSYDVRLCGNLCGEAPLDSGFEYSVDFVTYRDSVQLIDPDTKDTVLSVTTTSVSGVRAYLYPFNLKVEHFVNISPNFSNVQFRITTDGALIINKPVEIPTIPTKIVAVKGADLFGLSSVGRRIQVSGSTVGNRFEVRDMQGKVVRSGFVSAANFEIPVANAGVYLVRVGSVVRKVRIK